MAARMVGIGELRTVLAGSGHEPLTEMAVSKFVKDGMPKAARGLYDVDVCVSWYIGRLRTSVKRKERETPDGNTSNLEDERRRLIAAQADNEEMTASERRGNLIPLATFETRLGAFVSMTKTSLLNLPARLAGRVEGLTRAESKALITAAVRNCLGELAKNVSAQSARPAKPSAPAAKGKTARRKSDRKPRRSGK